MVGGRQCENYMYKGRVICVCFACLIYGTCLTKTTIFTSTNQPYGPKYRSVKCGHRWDFWCGERWDFSWGLPFANMPLHCLDPGIP
jgi:hypothetical protein